MVNLSEAFTKLKLIESEDFDLLNKEEKESFGEFLNETEENNDPVTVFDVNTVEEEELEDSYIGKIVCQCPVCKSLMFKGWDEFNEMEEEESCPYCFSVEHFDTIGKIEPLEDITAEVKVEEEAPVDESCHVDEGCDVDEGCVSRKIKESIRRPRKRRNIKESIEHVTVETDEEVITVNAEQKCDDCEEKVEEHEEVEVIAPLEEPEYEEITEVDEESFDEMAESWLKENYKNIKAYKTIRFTENKRTIRANGVVVLENGNKKRTTFAIRPGKLNEGLGTKVVVENLELGIKKTIKGQLK